MISDLCLLAPQNLPFKISQGPYLEKSCGALRDALDFNTTEDCRGQDIERIQTFIFQIVSRCEGTCGEYWNMGLS